jgi:hypothetical protein
MEFDGFSACLGSGGASVRIWIYHVAIRIAMGSKEIQLGDMEVPSGIISGSSLPPSTESFRRDDDCIHKTA